MKIKFFLLILSFFSLFSIRAQDKKKESKKAPTNIEKYTDNDRIGFRKHAVCLRVGKLINGNLGASYDTKFTRRLGIEAGLYYQIFPNTWGGIHYFETTTKNFFSIDVTPKLYLTGNKYINRGFYLCLKHRQWFGKFADNVPLTINATSSTLQDHPLYDSKVHIQDFGWGFGSHSPLKGSFTIGFEASLGLSVFKYEEITYDYKNLPPKKLSKKEIRGTAFVAMDLKFGYLF